MTKKPDRPTESLPPNLVQSREIAAQKIQMQIDKGVTLRNSAISTKDELDVAHAERSKWSKYNTELLTRLFDNSSIADEYNRFFGAVINMDPTFSERVENFRRDMDDSITRLEAIRDRLDLIPELGNKIGALPNTPSKLSEDIFVVHGHDEAAKEAVSRFVEKLGFKAIILHEQPIAGRTVIEKFKYHSQVGFAIVLLTPDDVGAIRDNATEGKPRARHNVIFELGYFIGKLGRQKVCALYKEGVELPSDFLEVLYTPMDPAGGWRLELAKEMKQAGFAVDMNRAF